MGKNPYTLTFGREPAQHISRASTIAQIVESFEGSPPAQQVYILTGVRGSGKTVLMTEVANRLRKDDEWVVVELNPERDMLESLAAKLSSENALAKMFKSAKINLSFFGLGLEVGGVAPITDIEVALDKMLASLSKHGKKVLVCVDEAVSTQNMRIFANAFQILVRRDLPLFFIMTGLYENIRKLQDEDTLTFLYRAPRIDMKPLNIGAIANNYRKNFGVNDDLALKMAHLTCGYPFAFQVLGYYSWEHDGFNEDALADFKQYLDEYAYEKIWSELSATDRRVAFGIAKSESGRVAEVREILQMDTNHFNPYRSRLIRKGLVDGTSHGHVDFTLPLFDQFVLENYRGD